jgi:hypothetical protein
MNILTQPASSHSAHGNIQSSLMRDTNDSSDHSASAGVGHLAVSPDVRPPAGGWRWELLSAELECADVGA